jgi:pimeloyl-ACP methyl ester carboxylesterase
MAEALATRVLGHGPAIVLVHGGVGPELTWRAQVALAERWRLVIPWRRGFPPSPPAERQDFLADADDLAELLASLRGAVHAVGYSYGGIGLATAVGRDPGLVRSLTLVELPIFSVALDDPDVAALGRVSDAYTGDGADSPRDEETVTAFERVFGVPPRVEGEQADALERARALARGLRSPNEAAPDLEAVAAAGVPALVVTGGHAAPLERIGDRLAARLGARRDVCTGAGHAVPRAPGFNGLLEGFLARRGAPGIAPDAAR